MEDGVERAVGVGRFVAMWVAWWKAEEWTSNYCAKENPPSNGRVLKMLFVGRVGGSYGLEKCFRTKKALQDKGLPYLLTYFSNKYFVERVSH